MTDSKTRIGAHAPVIMLAGGFGSRLSEETALRLKRMVDVGGRPILCAT